MISPRMSWHLDIPVFKLGGDRKPLEQALSRKSICGEIGRERGKEAAFRWRIAVLAATLLVFAVDHGGAFQNPASPDPNSPEILPRQASQPDSANVLLTEEERAWLREHPVIRVAQDPGWPPIEFADEKGRAFGIANDYLKLIEERLGVTFERVRGLSWQESYARLKRWDLDMTTSVTATTEREAFWAFTRPYMKSPVVILTRMDVPYIAGMRELGGKRVAGVDGYIAAESIPRDFPEIQLIKVGSVMEGIELLRKTRSLLSSTICSSPAITRPS